MNIIKIRQIFSYLAEGNGKQFFEYVDDNVNWTVMGTHPLAGQYISKQDFYEHTFARLNKILPGGTKLHIEHIFLSGDNAVLELRSMATAKNGMRFDNRYCWIVRFQDEMIVEVRAYLDSALVQKLIDENEIEGCHQL